MIVMIPLVFDIVDSDHHSAQLLAPSETDYSNDLLYAVAVGLE
jgi:hypothetical protein